MIKQIAERMHRINLINRILVYRAIKEENIYFGQFPLLNCVNQYPGITQREIARKLGVSPPSITNSVKRMEKNGLLMKRENQTDLRCSQISLTQKGKKVLEVCESKIDKVDASLFLNFTEEELTALNEFMARILDNLNKSEFETKDMPDLIGEADQMMMRGEGK